MVTYMTRPQTRVTVTATNYDNYTWGSVTRFENGFDTAHVIFPDVKAANRSNLAADSTISINVKDYTDGAYTNLLSGIIRSRTEALNPEQIICNCDQIGYCLAECLVGEEYGTESNNPTLDTLQEIITDATHGIVPAWVNKVLGTATASQYAVNTTKVENLAGTIPYLYLPYKPASKGLGDLIDLVTALEAGGAGPHWIVTVSGSTVYLRVKAIDGTQVGWTKYYGDSQANATLVQGTDFEEFYPETMNAQANYVLYHCPWIWPSNKDYVTETVAIGSWDSNDMSVVYDDTAPKVGTYNIKATVTNSTLFEQFNYPGTDDLGLDLTKAGGYYNKPRFGCWFKRNSDFSIASDPQLIAIYFIDAGAVWAMASVNLRALLPNADEWAYIDFEVGPYANSNITDTFRGLGWTAGFDWTSVNNISFNMVSAQPEDAELHIDGMNFTGWVKRGAYDSTSIADIGLRTRIVNDPFGKCDTLNTTDTGTVALLAYTELLRQSTTPTVGKLTTNQMIKDILPGQWVHIHARPNSAGTYQINQDFRVVSLTQRWGDDGYFTDLNLTSDLTNSFARAAYDSQNEIVRNQRPEFQDRQSTGIKMREIDITQPILAVDYG